MSELTRNRRFFPLPSRLLELCEHLSRNGGRGWLVGGCVRDLLLGHPPKDFDLEVYGLEVDRLEALTKQLGRTEAVGKQFGILKLWLDDLEIDVALPRTERKTASGHCGFAIQTDPFLTPEKASLRRDFTINAMMYDPLDGSLLDFHDGQRDLENRVLRHVSPAFSEDPLRPLRGMQFAARFRLNLATETAELCQNLLPEADQLPPSRIWDEWKKWACSNTPSYGLRALSDSGWISCYPELEPMIGCKQEPHWHPEGDVWDHTLQVCDQAAQMVARTQLDKETRIVLMLAALCHDLGKPVTTMVTDKGRIASPGHAEAGVEITRSFLQRISTPARFIERTLPLVKEHITHLHGEPTPRAVRRLADRLTPANIELWEILVEADASGRHPAPPSRPALPWLEIAKELKHQHSRPDPILTGKLLLQLGVAPGPVMGQILENGYQAQLDGVITDQTSAIAWYHNKSGTGNTQEK